MICYLKKVAGGSNSSEIKLKKLRFYRPSGGGRPPMDHC